jgi:hypothetical protein
LHDLNTSSPLGLLPLFIGIENFLNTLVGLLWVINPSHLQGHHRESNQLMTGLKLCSPLWSILHTSLKINLGYK